MRADFPLSFIFLMLRLVMSNKNRLLFAIGVLLLGTIYFFPLWSIELEAPQYPEGLGLYIWGHQITGFNENDLNNINALNHYIGMKVITMDSIPELKIIPPLIGGLMFLGLVVIFVNKKPFYIVWFGILIIILSVGLLDFYLWEYDYGHNLNPNAAIKIPGMSYQPPLIGSKQLLNINAISLPHIAGIATVLTTILSLYTIWKTRKDSV